MSLIQSLYIKQPPISTSDPEGWLEYKIKETNMFTVDKSADICIEIRQGVLGEDDTGEESPRNLKLLSRRPAVVCENCLYSFVRDARLRAFHIMNPQGILEMFIVVLEERGSNKIAHPSFDHFKIG